MVCHYFGLHLVSFSFCFRPTPAIEPEILRTMVVRHFIGYAPNPGNRKRNQVIYAGWGSEFSLLFDIHSL